MQMIRHIVLINWKPGATDQRIDEWVEQVNRIPNECSMVYNWCSSHAAVGPDVDNPSTHSFCIVFDIRSPDEFGEYLKHPYPDAVKTDGLDIIDLERTASTNMWIQGEPRKVASCIPRDKG
jgi:hypothetical protein